MDTLTTVPTTDAAPGPSAPAYAPLTASDRCDSCGSQAYVRATLPSGSSLLLCGHHAASHRPALLVAGARLHDETGRLQVRRESSAA